MSSKYGVGAFKTQRRASGEDHSKRQKEVGHHSIGSGPPSHATDEEVFEIRKRQNQGFGRDSVRRSYPHISDHSFRNIWEGVTKAYITGF